jgi:hypothetical protein
MSVAASGGPRRIPTPPPAVASAVAVPRRRSNHRGAVAYEITYRKLKPVPATTP